MTMAKNFTELAFTDSVRKMQEEYDTRAAYERFEAKTPTRNTLTSEEKVFVARRDAFYLASVGENGWPYVQFRGGPKGFLKVLDDETIGYADFQGNMQYISTGNINSTKKASLILLDYPAKKRLKIWVEAEILDPEDHPDLKKQLVTAEYQALVERLVVFRIKAFDWNCPQHINQRFTVDEFRDLIARQPEILTSLDLKQDDHNCMPL
jgi:predicted pyridoxine 5'-phosphate oxidase superfamily flavin-nucleotide-binding protein